MKVDEILAALTAMFPDAHCELNHRNPFELAVAVVLSAQTTDVSVNKVTPLLFEKYPTPQALAEAPLEDIVRRCCLKNIRRPRHWRKRRWKILKIVFAGSDYIVIKQKVFRGWHAASLSSLAA